jgi:hypothetical protein
MNEDNFNMSMRKLLKRVGVTSQREIEAAVQKSLEDGDIKGNEKLLVEVTLSIEGIKLKHVIEGEIHLE